jgi:hypothetical protein
MRKHNLKEIRLSVAMLKILQAMFQDTYIGTVTNNTKSPKLCHHLQVLTANATVQQYALKAVRGPNNTYSTKIVIDANHELKDFILALDFITYLLNEAISIAANSLNTAIP